MNEASHPRWRFFKIGLLVTGEGEERFLPDFLRVLTQSGRCTFKVVARIGQRSPITSERRRLRMVGTGKAIPDRDAESIGTPARSWLDGDDKLLPVIDDLEHDRRDQKPSIFRRYRTALDTMLLSDPLRARASVHFLVNMIEAYYFADANATNAVLGTNLQDCEGDVEEIRHPKNELKQLFSGFDEVEHGAAIVRRLDLGHVLDNPATCASLRVLVAWCTRAMGLDYGSRFRLDTGAHDLVTGPQLGPA